MALFDYDPVSMSPNPDAGEEELPFREGQILKVFGDKDADGFYRGEGGGRWGYIPCNMVAEVAMDSPAGTQQLLQQGHLSPEALAEGSGNGLFVYSTARTAGPPPKPRRSKKEPPQLASSASLKAPHSMVAAFDYNPRESSPNMDVEDWVSSTQGPPVSPGWPCAPGPHCFPKVEPGLPQGPSRKVWVLLSKGKQLLRKLGSGKE